MTSEYLETGSVAGIETTSPEILQETRIERIVRQKLDSWRDHYRKEPQNWPDDVVQSYSVRQVLHPSQYQDFGIDTQDGSEDIVDTVKEIVSFLYNNASFGLKCWVQDTYSLKKAQICFISDTQMLIAREAATFFPELTVKLGISSQI